MDKVQIKLIVLGLFMIVSSIILIRSKEYIKTWGVAYTLAVSLLSFFAGMFLIIISVLNI